MDIVLILNRLKKIKKISTDKELADFLGINKSTLSNWKKRNSIDFDLLFSKCKHSISIDWLLTGEGEALKKERQNESEQKTKNEENLNISNVKKNVKENVKIRNMQKTLTNEVSEPSPPYNSQSELIELLKENKKLVEKHNTMLEKEVCRLTERNEFLEGENKRLALENKGLREEIRKVKATKKMPTKKESKPEEV